MKLYSQNENYKLYNGDMNELNSVIENNSIDAVVTDPPYELGFMGKSWDASGVAFRPETWRHCWDVLKPGGYLLAFGGSRTFHRIACAIEDAGFEIRDTVMWVYGCLSEDTEVLTTRGFKKFSDIQNGDAIRVYDIENGIYKWEIPQRWNTYSVNKDTCYRIKSDSTDQLVSRNHRCLVERDGSLAFEFAENLSNMERVPVLSYDIPFIQKGQQRVLLTDLLWQDERLAYKLCEQWQGQEESKEIALGRNEPILERWGNLPQQERELFCSENKKCEVSPRVYDDGEKRWICDGAQANCGSSDWATTVENRSSASYKPQCRGQQAGESDVVCNEQRPQDVRGWAAYTTSLATITTEEYTGIIFCPTVSTGCFVARRNGKVFLTGNSGFPKSMNIGLAIDKKNGVESKVVGVNKNVRPDSASHNDIFTIKTEGDGFYTKKATNKWNGWGTALKPAYEPIIVARKPCEGSCVDNVLTYGVGGINIDECRVGTTGGTTKKDITSGNETKNAFGDGLNGSYGVPIDGGRFPANLILTYNEEDKDEVCGGFPDTKSTGGSGEASRVNTFANTYNGGWGTALKPAYEPIIVARKPCEGSCVDNVLTYGVGGINIDECRVEHNEECKIMKKQDNINSIIQQSGRYEDTLELKPEGRFPANLILTYNEEDKDEVCGGFPDTKSTGGSGEASKVNTFANTYNGGWGKEKDCSHLGGLGDEGSASRYFYNAKASKRDRDEGLDGFEVRQSTGGGGGIGDYLDDVNSCSGKYGSEKAPARNFHPTVKPTALMSYLIRLVSPKGATILDPFMGSGSTGKAAMYENKDRNADYKFIGIELTDEYLPIAKARIDYVINNGVALDRGEDETTNEVSSEPKPKFERFTWDLE